MFHHVVIPLDGSSESERAIPIGVDIAERYAARLTLFAVSEPMRWEEAPQYLEAVAAPLIDARSCRVGTATASGEPADAIVEYVDTSSADLIVMSTQGAGRAGRYRLGSVANEVLLSSGCPVLMVRRSPHLEE